tara:strand:+ start:180 stop:518 length:339 start_codon:yes stop_codon:yes gene_type:complete
MENLNPELRSMDSQMLAEYTDMSEQGNWMDSLLGGVGGFIGDTLSQMQGNTTLPYGQQAQGQLRSFQAAPMETKLEIVLMGLAAAAAATTGGAAVPLMAPLMGGAGMAALSQ